MDEFIQLLQSIIQEAQENVDEFDEEELAQIEQFVSTALEFIASRPQDRMEPPLPLGADLLWQLANGNPEAFINYLRTVPDPHLRMISRNPSQMQDLIERLSRQFPSQERIQSEGIEQAPLQSSNIWGFHYNPQSGHLLVRFQGGSIYAYEHVPPHIFKVFQSGAVPAKTNGQNQYGKWWQGKIPSLGAAFYELIRNGGYPYQQVA